MPIKWSAVRVSETVDEIEELTKSMGAPCGGFVRRLRS